MLLEEAILKKTLVLAFNVGDQCYPLGFAQRWSLFISAKSNKVMTSCMWPLNTRNVVGATEELNFHFYLVLIHLSLDSHTWFMASMLAKL